MAVQSSHGLHSMGQGFAGKRMLGYQRDPVMRTGEPTPAPEPPCKTCGRSVEATTCTTYRNGKTYRTTYRTCLSARKLRYGKTQTTCAVQVEEVEIDNEMPNPTGKRPTLDRIPDKADQAEWQRLKAALKLSNKHLIEASGVRSMALYDWFADRLVTQETENRIKDGLRKLQDQEAGRTHVYADEANSWAESLQEIPTAAELAKWVADASEEKNSIEARISRLEEFVQESPPGPAEWIEQPAEWPAKWQEQKLEFIRNKAGTIWQHAAFFEKVAQTMAEADIHVFRAVCQRVLEQVAK